MTRVNLQYFAQLREQAGVGDEAVDTSAATPRELYAELRERHGFSLSADSLKVAVNERFSDWQHALADGDTVVFVPPVAGG